MLMKTSEGKAQTNKPPDPLIGRRERMNREIEKKMDGSKSREPSKVMCNS